MVSGTSSTSFEWSLKPVLICTKFLGIRFPANSNGFIYLASIIARSLACLVFIFNLLVNGQMVVYYFKNFSFFDESAVNVTELLEEMETKSERNLIRNQAFVTCFTIFICFSYVPLIHLYFMSTSIFYPRLWGDLWARLQSIQRELDLDGIFHRRCRKTCCAVSLLFLLVTIIYF